MLKQDGPLDSAGVAHLPKPVEQTFLVDGAEIDAQSPGLAYRATPNVADKVAGAFAAWGSKVSGINLDDRWLKTSKGYLPFNIDGDEVLFTADGSEDGIVAVRSTPRLWGHADYGDAMEVGLKTWEEIARAQGHFGRPCRPENALQKCSHRYVCKEGVCDQCALSRDCHEKHSCEFSADAGRKVCIPRTLRASWSWKETLCTVLVVVTAVLSAAAGMGGGGVYVPLLLLLLGLSTKEAVPLSQAMIVGGATINIIMFCGDRHPKFVHRPKIDYDVVMMLNPGLAAGVTLGVMCNLVTPQWIIILILIGTLVLALQKSLAKGLQSFQKESDELAKAAAVPQPLDTAKFTVRFVDFGSFAKLAGESHHELSLILGCWLVFLLCNFIKAPACSHTYWMQHIGLVGACFCFTAAGARVIRSKLSSKESLEGMLTWTDRTLLLYPLLATGAGFLGGFLGIGGGIIMGPVLLELGMDAQASQATTATFVFLSSSLAALQFMVLGKAMPEFAAWFTMWVIVSTFVGQTVVDYILQRWRRSSLIVLSIAGIIAGSMVMMTAIGARDIYSDLVRGADMGFNLLRMCQR